MEESCPLNCKFILHTNRKANLCKEQQDEHTLDLTPNGPHLFFPFSTSSPVRKGHSKIIQPHRSKHTQSNWQWLLAPNRTRNAATGKYNAGEQSQLDAVCLPVLDSVAADQVESTDRAASGERRDGACARISCDTTTGGQDTEDVGDLIERLGGSLVLVYTCE